MKGQSKTNNKCFHVQDSISLNNHKAYIFGHYCQCIDTTDYLKPRSVFMQKITNKGVR